MFTAMNRSLEVSVVLEDKLWGSLLNLLILQIFLVYKIMLKNPGNEGKFLGNSFHCLLVSFQLTQQMTSLFIGLFFFLFIIRIVNSYNGLLKIKFLWSKFKTRGASCWFYDHCDTNCLLHLNQQYACIIY